MPDSGRLPRPTLLEWIALAAGIGLTLRYAWLLDDAFIYFRYVDNLLFLDRGLVFNEGEYVEGYTSPLWALLLIGLRASELNYWLLVRGVGVAAFVATWWMLLRLDRRLSPAGGPRFDLPALYLCFHYGLLSYFTSGMETPLLILCAVAYARWIADPRPLAPALLVGLSPLVRHELLVPLAIGGIWEAWRRGAVPWRTLGLAGVPLAAWLAFRVTYYADFLPNTFYLKDDVDWSQGWLYLHDALSPYGLYVLAPLLLGGALLLARRGVAFDARARGVMLLAAASVALYVVRIGGDGRHLRYLVFPTVLAVCAAGGLPEHLIARFAPRLRPAVVTLIGALFALLVLSFHPRQLLRHPLRLDGSSARAHYQRRDLIHDAQFHRMQADLGFDPWSWGGEADRLTVGEGEALHAALGEPVPDRELERLAAYRRYLDRRGAGERPPTATERWCASAFRRFSERLVHIDGLTDAFLARTRMQATRPGHYGGYRPLARELARIQSERGWGPGVLRATVEAGEASPWIATNLETLELVERKVYNRHDPIENLALALRFPARMTP